MASSFCLSLGNEAAAQRTEPAEQRGDGSGSSASQSGLQIGSPLSADVAEDSTEDCCTVEDQKVADAEEKLPDQIQSTKEEALAQMTKYHIHQGAGDIVMIQSDHTGAVDILSAELETADLLGEQRKAQPPPLAPPTTWTTGKMKEFKAKMGKEKSARMVVKRGEVVTVRVPTHPDGKRVCWEFATDDYDIGFGVYFEWTTVTSTAITVQVSESSDEEDEEEEEEIEGLASGHREAKLQSQVFASLMSPGNLSPCYMSAFLPSQGAKPMLQEGKMRTNVTENSGPCPSVSPAMHLQHLALASSEWGRVGTKSHCQ
uniref:Transmembrane p24 trafficking protein family member 8 n=1 Tax=Coturnix japonica TaxID=93934 RepID=A0A8C2UBD8_COTJA